MKNPKVQILSATLWRDEERRNEEDKSTSLQIDNLEYWDGRRRRTLPPVLELGDTSLFWRRTLPPVMELGDTRRTLPPVLELGDTRRTLPPVLELGDTRRTLPPVLELGDTRRTLPPVLELGDTSLFRRRTLPPVIELGDNSLLRRRTLPLAMDSSHKDGRYSQRWTQQLQSLHIRIRWTQEFTYFSLKDTPSNHGSGHIHYHKANTEERKMILITSKKKKKNIEADRHQ